MKSQQLRMKIKSSLTEEVLEKIAKAIENNPQLGEEKRKRAKKALEETNFIESIISKKKL